MENQKNHLPALHLNTSKNLRQVLEGGKSIAELANENREKIKMILVAGLADLVSYFKVGQKMEPKEGGEMTLLIMKHETYSTYTLEMFGLFFQKCKRGELGKSFNRIDVPTVFEMLATFNGLLELEKELKHKDTKHVKQENTRQLVGSLFDKFKEMGLSTDFRKKRKPQPPKEVKHTYFDGEKLVDVTDKLNEAYKEFDQIYDNQTAELKKGPIRLITHDGQRIDVTTFVNIKLAI